MFVNQNANYGLSQVEDRRVAGGYQGEAPEEEQELVRSGRARTDSSADLIQLHTKHRQLTITVKAEREREIEREGNIGRRGWRVAVSAALVWVRVQ